MTADAVAGPDHEGWFPARGGGSPAPRAPDRADGPDPRSRSPAAEAPLPARGGGGPATPP